MASCTMPPTSGWMLMATHLNLKEREMAKQYPLSENKRISAFPILGTFALLIGLVVIMGASAASCVQVDKGQVGVKTTWGRVDPDALKPGLHFIIPVAQRVTHVNVQVT